MKLTSSNFAAAMGLSPYQSRQKLWRVLTGRENRDPVNAAMQWGIDNEHRAVAAAEAITGLLFSNTGTRQKHYELAGDIRGIDVDEPFDDEHKVIYGATPDGEFASGEDWTQHIGLEVKCPGNLTETVPEHYLPQVQGQMYIAEYGKVVFCQWTNEEARAWIVEGDGNYQLAMLELLREFMLCIKNDVEPKKRKKPILPELTITRIN